MKQGKWSKCFPKKKIKSQTIFDDNGFVYYRRREQHGKFIFKDRIQLRNFHFISYNKELLLRYNAHINVKICCQSMVIKFLFNCVNKGSDRCWMTIAKDNNDEIKSYLNCSSPQHQNIVFPGNQSLLSVLKKPGVDQYLHNVSQGIKLILAHIIFITLIFLISMFGMLAKKNGYLDRKDSLSIVWCMSTLLLKNYILLDYF